MTTIERPTPAEALERAVERFCRAWDVLEREAAQSAWYAQVWAARANLAVSDDLLARAWETAKAAGGEKARLCRLWEEVDAAGRDVLACERGADEPPAARGRDEERDQHNAV